MPLCPSGRSSLDHKSKLKAGGALGHGTAASTFNSAPPNPGSTVRDLLGGMVSVQMQVQY